MNIGQRVVLLDTEGKPSALTGNVRGTGSVGLTYGYIVLLDGATQDHVNANSGRDAYISLIIVEPKNLLKTSY